MKSIKVTNHQTIDNETDVIEEKGIGTCREKNGKYYIIYDVKTEDGIVKVTVIADNETVKIKRSGYASSEMVYDIKKPTAFRYNTPYGAIDMEIKTTKIHNGLNVQGGVLRIMYTLLMQGMATYNDTEIEVKDGE